MTSFNPTSWTTILDFTILLKGQERTENNVKSRRNSCNFDEESWNKIFGQTYMKFVVAITTSKIAEQLLKLSAP